MEPWILPATTKPQVAIINNKKSESLKVLFG
jgi:hypothetical protein